MVLPAGLVGIIPALGMMTRAQNPPSGGITFGPGQLLLWSLSLAFFGVFIAVPLRTQTIIKVKLRPFATSSAMAHLPQCRIRQPANIAHHWQLLNKVACVCMHQLCSQVVSLCYKVDKNISSLSTAHRVDSRIVLMTSCSVLYCPLHSVCLTAGKAEVPVGDGNGARHSHAARRARAGGGGRRSA